MNEAKHVFTAKLTWLPSGLKFVPKEYSRLYLVRSPGKQDFLGTAAPGYAGSPYHYNPEDLLVVALGACHMLTYLAYAANSKIEVLSYEDAAEGTLAAADRVMKFTEVVLRPRLRLAGGADVEKARGLHDKAHRACFIANSVNFPVRIEGEFEVAGT